MKSFQSVKSDKQAQHFPRFTHLIDPIVFDVLHIPFYFCVGNVGLQFDV